MIAEKQAVVLEGDLDASLLDEFLTAVPASVQLYFDAKAIPPDALSAAVEKYHLAERTIVHTSS